MRSKLAPRPPFGQMLEAFAAVTGEEAELRAALERTHRSLARARTNLREQHAARRRSRLKLVATSVPQDDAKIDAEIEELAAEERQLATDYRSCMKAIRALVANMRRDRLPVADRAEEVFSEFDRLMVEMLQRSRDLRWELMQQRAARPDARGGTIVTNVKALRRHLARLGG